MLQDLTSKIKNVLNRITNRSKITQQDVELCFKELKRTFIEADVSTEAIKLLFERINQKVIGGQILKKVRAGDMVIKAIYDELVRILGGDPEAIEAREKLADAGGEGEGNLSAKNLLQSLKKGGLNSVSEMLKASREELQKAGKDMDENTKLSKVIRAQQSDDEAAIQLNIRGTPRKPGIIMLVGLQGAGKTTTCAKLGLFLQNAHEKKVLMVSTDIYRPAAQQQLATLGQDNNIATLPIQEGEKPQQIVERAKNYAAEIEASIILVDTAGRTNIDAAMLDELAVLKAQCNPQEVLLVADAMLGQEAARIAHDFDQAAGITGVVLSRTDSDARFGAALSMVVKTGKAIRFVGTGEKVEDIEVFYPERIAARILGKGDVVSLVEKAAENMSLGDAQSSIDKLQSGSFNMNDMLQQIQSMEKMGSIDSILGMLPGLGAMRQKINQVMGPDFIKKRKAIISSMTPRERTNPDLIKRSRILRIAKGSGTSEAMVNSMLKQFFQMKTMMKKFGKMDGGSLQQMMQMFQ